MYIIVIRDVLTVCLIEMSPPFQFPDEFFRIELQVFFVCFFGLNEVKSSSQIKVSSVRYFNVCEVSDYAGTDVIYPG